MADLKTSFVDPERARLYIEKGPSAFMPGHAGLMQMIAVLLGETMVEDGTVLVIGAGQRRAKMALRWSRSRRPDARPCARNGR